MRICTRAATGVAAMAQAMFHSTTCTAIQLLVAVTACTEYPKLQSGIVRVEGGVSAVATNRIAPATAKQLLALDVCVNQNQHKQGTVCEVGPAEGSADHAIVAQIARRLLLKSNILLAAHVAPDDDCTDAFLAAPAVFVTSAAERSCSTHTNRRSHAETLDRLMEYPGGRMRTKVDRFLADDHTFATRATTPTWWPGAIAAAAVWGGHRLFVRTAKE